MPTHLSIQNSLNICTIKWLSDLMANEPKMSPFFLPCAIAPSNYRQQKDLALLTVRPYQLLFFL